MKYQMFDRYLNKITAATKASFRDSSTDMSYLMPFFEAVSRSGNVTSAIDKVEGLDISPLQINSLISKDRALQKCIELAQYMAMERVDGLLYDRVMEGDEERSYDKAGNCISVKKKHCSKSILDYLRSNSPKYQNDNRSSTKDNADDQEPDEDGIPVYEIKSFEEPDDYKEQVKPV